MGFLAISSMMFLGGIYVMFAFTWWILQIVANWRIFTKAGEAGWKSIIPVYGDYISYKIAWQTGYFWLMFVLGIISSWIQNYCELPKINPLNAGFHPNNYAKFTCPACLQAYSVLFCSSSDVSPEVINARISS